MAKRAIRVVVADDHPIVAEGLRSSLQEHDDLVVVDTAMSFEALFEIIGATPVDVVVLDVKGMHGSPLSTIERLRREHPDVRVLVYSSSVDLSPELRRAGAHGYASKTDTLSSLAAGIRTIHAGELYFSPAVRHYLARSRNAAQESSVTAAELRVLKMLALGYGTMEMAEQLKIDGRTVQKHITDMYAKLGFNQRTQLVEWYRLNYGEPGS